MHCLNDETLIVYIDCANNFQILLQRLVLCQVLWLATILVTQLQQLTQVLCQTLLPRQVPCQVLCLATILVVQLQLLTLLVILQLNQRLHVLPVNTMVLDKRLLYVD